MNPHPLSSRRTKTTVWTSWYRSPLINSVPQTGYMTRFTIKRRNTRTRVISGKKQDSTARPRLLLVVYGDMGVLEQAAAFDAVRATSSVVSIACAGRRSGRVGVDTCEARRRRLTVHTRERCNCMRRRGGGRRRAPARLLNGRQEVFGTTFRNNQEAKHRHTDLTR